MFFAYHLVSVEDVLGEKVEGGTEENQGSAIAEGEVDADGGVFLPQALTAFQIEAFAAYFTADEKADGAESSHGEGVWRDLLPRSVGFADASDTRGRYDRHAEKPEQERKRAELGRPQPAGRVEPPQKSRYDAGRQ